MQGYTCFQIIKLLCCFRTELLSESLCILGSLDVLAFSLRLGLTTALEKVNVYPQVTLCRSRFDNCYPAQALSILFYLSGFSTDEASKFPTGLRLGIYKMKRDCNVCSHCLNIYKRAALLFIKKGTGMEHNCLKLFCFAHSVERLFRCQDGFHLVIVVASWLQLRLRKCSMVCMMSISYLDLLVTTLNRARAVPKCFIPR